MKTITLVWLRRKGACSGAIEAFQKRFGDKASVEDVANILHEFEERDWEAWLLAQDLELTVLMLENDVDIHVGDDYALYLAARNGRTSIVQFLLEKGADVHADYDVALRIAAEFGHLKVVQLLVEHGANIHAYSDAALRVAAEYGRLKVVQLLVENGANIHADNDAAFHRAARSGHPRVSQFLRRQSQKV